MKPSKLPPVQRDWLAKTLAGALLGFVLAIGASTLFSALNPGMSLPARGQLAMWMVPAVWFTTLAAVYFFQSGRQAWLWLASANLLLYGATALVR